MAQFNIIISSGTAPYTLSIKKIGDNTERYISGGTTGSGTVLFNDDLGVTSYVVTVSSVGCQSYNVTIDLNCGNDVSKVYHEGGKKIYKGDGTLDYIPINPVITNDYTFTETVCRTCPSGYRLMYAFEEGYELSSDYEGWKYQTQGLSIDLSKMAGKTILYRSACVGYAYNEVKDLHSTYIYLKRNNINRNVNGLIYLNYANSFIPDFSRNIPSLFLGKIPPFYLDKNNLYEGVMPTDSVTVDLSNYGIKAWHLKRNSSFPIQKGYITDPDTQFGDAASYNQTHSTNLVDTFSTQEMINRADGYSGYGDLNTLIIDDEFRQGVYYNGTGLDNMLTFFQRTKQNLPNTNLSAHHNFPIGWNKNNATDLSDANLFNGFYSNERDLYVARNNGFLAQYWIQQGDKNIGNDIFKIISLDAYIHFYNNPSEPFKWAMLCKIHKKWYPNHIITPTIEGWLELLGNDFGADSKEVISWKTGNNSAETLGAFPIMSISQFEQSAVIGNLLGDGVNFWGDFLTRQDNYPNAYYANNSLNGTPEGYVNESICNQYGVYQSQPSTGIDYWFLALQKLSQIPQGYDWSNLINYEISLDNGTTWVTGDDLIYGFAFRRHHPMVFGFKNAQNKFFICAIHPFNNPIDTYTFKVRTTGMSAIDITVDGQFPQLIINNN